MGNIEIKTDIKAPTFGINNFKREKIVGLGAFSQVWKALYLPTKRQYAIKEMHKSRVVRKNCVDLVINELELLSKLKHPFIVNVQQAFQDRENLYLVMDLMPGGDLRYFLTNRTISEIQARFIISCVLMGLEYLHINGVVHRDIKPENLVFDNKGYLRITDFGLACYIGKIKQSTGSGTLGYMSPETMFRKRQGMVSDFFALGVIAYECMLGKQPYYGKNRKEIKDLIMTKQVQLKRKDVPQGWSLESADFINKLIQRNPKERLGYNGIHEIKNHNWINCVNWKKMLEKTVESPCKVFNFADIDQKGIDIRRTDSDFDLDYVQKYFDKYRFVGNANFGLTSTNLK